MKRQVAIVIAILVLGTTGAFAQSNGKRAEDEKAVRQVIKNIADAWAAGDGVNYADNFTDDVIYTVWNGHQINGRAENISGHQEIFDTIYKGTTVRWEIQKIRFLSDDVAVAKLQGEMFRGDKKVEDVPVVVPAMILKKEQGKWRVAVFQNTPMIRRGEFKVGGLSEAK